MMGLHTLAKFDNNNYTVVLSVFLLCNFISANVHSQIAGGLGAAYGSDIKQIAPNVRAYYFPNEKICVGPEVSWFPSVSENGVTRSLIEYNISSHYLIDISKHSAFYPLVGINYSTEKETLPHEQSESAWGANIGTGAHLMFGRCLPFIEYKYVTGNLKQHSFNIGMLLVLVDEVGQKSDK